MKENINPRDWDSAREMVKGRTEEIRSVNAHMDDVRFRIKEKYRMLQKKECIVTAQAVKDAFLGNRSIQKGRNTLHELIQFHFKIEGDKLRAGTIKNYNAIEEYLKRFIKWKFAVEAITLNKINYEFITELEFFIR